jgi:hypothetical protein
MTSLLASSSAAFSAPSLVVYVTKRVLIVSSSGGVRDGISPALLKSFSATGSLTLQVARDSQKPRQRREKKWKI